MRVLLHFVDLALAIYTWLLVVAMVLYWLIGFGVIETSRRSVSVVRCGLSYVVEPVLRLIRLILPKFSVDVSPLLDVLIIMVLRYVIALYVLPKLP